MRDEERAPTLKELRELRGLSLEELAARTEIPETVLQRWEEVGIDAAPFSSEADFLRNNYLSVVMKVLDADSVASKYAPSTPQPGQIIIEPPPPSAKLSDQLFAHAEELAMRMALPTEWGIVLKDARDVTEEDAQAIADHQAEEIAIAEESLMRFEAAMGLLEGHEEGTTLGEALNVADEELEADLRRLSEGREE